MEKESPLLYSLKPEGSSPHCHSAFCSKFVETKTSSTVRADLITQKRLMTSHVQIRQQNVGHLASNPYENVTQFKYLRITLINQNCKEEKNLGNVRWSPAAVR
jgi:hypothetical protein